MKVNKEEKIRQQQENDSKSLVHLHQHEELQNGASMKLVYVHPGMSQSLDPSRKFNPNADLNRPTNSKVISRTSALPGITNVVVILFLAVFASIFTSCEKEQPIQTQNCTDCKICPDNPLCPPLCSDCDECPNDPMCNVICIDCSECPEEEHCQDVATTINNEIQSLFVLNQESEITDPPVLVSTTLEEEGELSCTVKSYKWGLGSESPFLYDPTSDVIFVGNILDGESIVNGGYRPVLNAYREPINISISSTNFDAPVATVEKPSLSTYRNAWNSMVDGGTNGSVGAKIDYKFQKIHSNEQLKVALEGNLKIPFSSISASYNFDDSSVKTRFLVKYVQEYYSVDMDIPNQVSDFFYNAPADLASLDYGPVYVSSIKYGRTMMAMISSSDEANEVEAALKAKINFILKGGIDASLEQKRIINTSTINVLVLGGTPTAINGVDDIARYIQEGVQFSKDSPGVPMAYTLRYLKDNSIAKIVQSSDYKIRDCEVKASVHTFTPSDIYRFYPTRLNGDREFNGNGPAVVANCEIFISSNRKEILLKKFFRANEIDGDSKAEKEETTTLILAPNGKKFLGITSDKFTKAQYVDNDRDLDILSIPCNEDACSFSGNLVQRFEVIGDTEGHDLGPNPHDTHLSIFFNKITYELVNE